MSLLMNSGYLVLRWTVFFCTLSSSSTSVPFYLVITPLHINYIIPPSHVPQLLTILIKLLAVLPHLHNFVSSSFSTPQQSTASDPLLFLSSHLFLVPTLLLSAAPFPLLLRSRLKYEETIKLWFISIWTGGRQATVETTTEPWKSIAELF